MKILLYMVFILYSLLNTEPARADSLYCSHCEKSISGKYWRFESGSGEKILICSECYNSATRCDWCKIPVKEEYYQDNKTLCSPCYYKLLSMPSCNICLNHVTGEYYKFSRKNKGEIYICSKCASVNKKCEACAIPCANLRKINGRNICPDCSSTVQKCKGCQTLILDKGYTYDIYDFIFCEKCVNGPSCSVCTLPAGKDFIQLSDGRRICPECLKTSVSSIETVRRIYDIVAQFLSREFSMEIGEIANIQFREISEFREMAKKINNLEKNTVPLGLFRHDENGIHIFVQKNLPRNLLTGVIAHEYAHQYVHKTNPGYDNLTMEEGFCEWIRYKTLEKMGDEKGMKLVERQEGIYGKGFRKIQKLESRSGSAAVLSLFEK